MAAADPIGLARFLRMHAELLELTDARKVTVVVNKVRASAIGSGCRRSGAADPRRASAGSRMPVLVPWDLAAFDAAILERSVASRMPRRGPPRASPSGSWSPSG